VRREDWNETHLDALVAGVGRGRRSVTWSPEHDSTSKRRAWVLKGVMLLFACAAP
jgi:hypothetical protein